MTSDNEFPAAPVSDAEQALLEKIFGNPDHDAELSDAYDQGAVNALATLRWSVLQEPERTRFRRDDVAGMLTDAIDMVVEVAAEEGREIEVPTDAEITAASEF